MLIFLSEKEEFPPVTPQELQVIIDSVNLIEEESLRTLMRRFLEDYRSRGMIISIAAELIEEAGLQAEFMSRMDPRCRPIPPDPHPDVIGGKILLATPKDMPIA